MEQPAKTGSPMLTQVYAMEHGDSERKQQALAKLVGCSSAFQQAISHLPAIASSDASVLVTGETGTGKELVARAVHYLSRRSAFPFVAVNCGSLPETLMEAELFGHERGAYTDAQTKRIGLIAQAEGGTFFLDEVDTLPPKAQVDLLRVLQDKRYRALGSGQEQQADVRIIAASNATLLQLVKHGSFRADLYYRLCVFTVHLPSLRERPEDIPLLARHFLKKHLPEHKRELRLSPEAEADLLPREWPGNVRELENAIIRGIYLCQGDCIAPGDLTLPPRGARPAASSHWGGPKLQDFRTMKKSMIESFERDYLTRLMVEHKGNVSIAARASGKERRDLGKLLKKYNFHPKDFQALNENVA